MPESKSANSIKCLSLSQPNAWLLFHGRDIQSLDYLINHKGLIIIHAGKLANKRQLKQINLDEMNTPNLAELPTQAIIGNAEIVSCSWSDETRAYHWHFSQPNLWGKSIPFVAKTILFNISLDLINSHGIDFKM
ncbi:MAG: hypothetical protein RMY36_030900 [Nostoc sp. SerVER01]|nr:hypothetical protein [Nostoc sp. SerVER01]